MQGQQVNLGAAILSGERLSPLPSPQWCYGAKGGPMALSTYAAQVCSVNADCSALLQKRVKLSEARALRMSSPPRARKAPFTRQLQQEQ